MILVYFAGTWGCQKLLKELDAKLIHDGIQVHSSWIHGSKENTDRTFEGRRLDAEMDLKEIRESDMLVLFEPEERGKGGKHVEMGYAMGLGKPVIVVGNRCNVFDWADSVTVIPNVDTLKDTILNLANMLRQPTV